jgi:hypothetical protein
MSSGGRSGEMTLAAIERFADPAAAFAAAREVGDERPGVAVGETQVAVELVDR